MSSVTRSLELAKPEKADGKMSRLLIKCPLCKGRGKIETEKGVLNTSDKRYIADFLREQGYSIRAIAKVIDVKSPNSVQYLLRTQDK